MIKNCIVCFLLILPNIAFSSSGSCAITQLSDYLMWDNNIIVSFKVINSQFSEGTETDFIEIEIIKEFYSNTIEDTRIKIDTKNVFGPELNLFEKNIEWLTVLSKYNDSYSIAGCAPVLTIESEAIIGNTGIDALNKLDEPITAQMFDLALSAFQQGISSADKVCKSENSYCTERATYDRETGILSLPSVKYTSFGVTQYAKAKMQKVSEDLKTFEITEVE